MPQKVFNLYNPDFDADTASDQLVLEVSTTHMACLARKNGTQNISAFELFTFTTGESADFEKLFLAVLVCSRLLDKSYQSATLYINHEYAVLVPAAKFNKEIAREYLDLVHGENEEAQLFYDHLTEEKGIVNVYRVSQNWLDVLQTHLLSVTVKHAFSSVVPPLLRDHADGAAVIKVQFYFQRFVASVASNGKLQFIQNYLYQTPEDVLYHLLNLAQQLDIYKEETKLEISGMIDLNSALHTELAKYFSNIVVENANNEILLMDTNGQPLHYFTPFINLSA